MDLVQAILVGVLQGVFEWLPVSSEAVISLVLTAFTSSNPAESINTAIFLHLGTMFSALIYFRKEYFEVLKESPAYIETAGGKDASLLEFLLVSTLITGGLGFFVYKFLLEYVPSNPAAFTLLIGGMLLVTGLMQRFSGEDRRERGMEDTGFVDAAFAGVLQSLSAVPGISRSGSTVFGLLYRDFSSEDAFKLSFLMSVPAVLGANVFLNLEGFNYTPELLIAASTAAVAGYASIETVLRLAEEFDVEYMCYVLAALSFLGALI